jgi:hypothetical protein
MASPVPPVARSRVGVAEDMDSIIEKYLTEDKKQMIAASMIACPEGFPGCA